MRILLTIAESKYAFAVSLKLIFHTHPKYLQGIAPCIWQVPGTGERLGKFFLEPGGKNLKPALIEGEKPGVRLVCVPQIATIFTGSTITNE